MSSGISAERQAELEERQKELIELTRRRMQSVYTSQALERERRKNRAALEELITMADEGTAYRSIGRVYVFFSFTFPFLFITLVFFFSQIFCVRSDALLLRR